jgi:hypothetical protein
MWRRRCAELFVIEIDQTRSYADESVSTGSKIGPATQSVRHGCRNLW